jgi:uncharacterized protein (TIGR02145 family)
MKHTLIFLILFLTGFSNAQTVTIGSQVWMTKNLDVSTFRNGDPIPEAKTDEEWKKAGENKQPAWCYYDNDPANGEKYCKLYNWYAVNDPRGLAPVGYHIPSDAEWTILLDNLGSNSLKKMKSTSGWNRDFGKTVLINDRNGMLKKEVNKTRNGNGTNRSGFSGLPGGGRNGDGSFSAVGNEGEWWSSTEIATHYARHYVLGSRLLLIVMTESKKESGLSVRCIKD